MKQKYKRRVTVPLNLPKGKTEKEKLSGHSIVQNFKAEAFMLIKNEAEKPQNRKEKTEIFNFPG